MLLNYVISFLYMSVLKIFFGKYFFCSFFLYFLGFLCEVSGRWFYLSERWGRCVWTFLIQVRTCALVRYLTWHYVRTVNPWGLNRIIPCTTRLPHIFSLFCCRFVHFSLHFSCACPTCSCPFVISLHPRYDYVPFYWFLLIFYA
jgi:hypothetical protein